MKYLVYISSAYELMEDEELLDILTVSRRNNAERNLTGMLIYGEGTFIQVLEGDEDKLKETYRNIAADPRHKSIIKMAEGEVKERNFADWAMGFKSVNAEELARFSGYINPKGNEFLKNEEGNPIISMLKTFVSTNRIN